MARSFRCGLSSSNSRARLSDVARQALAAALPPARRLRQCALPRLPDYRRQVTRPARPLGGRRARRHGGPRRSVAVKHGRRSRLVTVVAEFVEALQPMSAAAGLFALSTNLSFGRAGELVIPTISDLPMADFVAEGAPIPVVMGLTSGVSMSPYKIASIIALTNEMMRSWNAEALVRAALTCQHRPVARPPAVLGRRRRARPAPAWPPQRHRGDASGGRRAPIRK